MVIIYSVSNSKGGCGKTSTALNLGAALSAAGKSVALVDNDVQSNLTASLGYTPAEQSRTLANLLLAAIDYPEDLDFHCYNANRPGEARQPGVLFSYSRLSYNGREIGLTRLLMD